MRNNNENLVRIMMKRTIDDQEIPNGTFGFMVKKRVDEPGLKVAKFDNGAIAFIYMNEIEVLNAEQS